MKLAHPQLKFTHYDMNGADDVVKYGKWRQMARWVYLCVCAGVCVEYVDVDSDFVRARSDLPRARARARALWHCVLLSEMQPRDMTRFLSQRMRQRKRMITMGRPGSTDALRKGKDDSYRFKVAVDSVSR